VTLRLKLVTAPAAEPLSVSQLKTHLRIDHNDEDDDLEDLIIEARQKLESDMRRAFITQTWRMSLDGWPTLDEILLPRPPLQSVTSIVYKDSEGTPTTWSSSAYIVDTDSEPGRIVLAYGETWPSLTLYPANPIQVTFVPGYGDGADDVPGNVKRALKLLCGHWYENREGTVSGTIARDIPMAVESLIWMDRNFP
jgi:uncharacterized phiE125 gp8 family phage protein